MKKYAFFVFASFYILCIVFNSVCSTYIVSCDYYGVKKNNLFVASLHWFLRIESVRVFTHLTGSDSGYGYFAPNVKSNGLLMTEACGQKLVPQFNSFEARIRYRSITSRLIDDVLSNRDTTGMNPAKLKLEKDYNNLVYKNIALKLLNDNHCTDDSMRVSYNIIVLPSLAEKREKEASTMALLKYKELTFSLNNH